MEPLDNPVWHALGGPHAHFAEHVDSARRYDPEVAPFGGLPDDPTDDDWEALRRLLGSDGAAVLMRTPVAMPPAWTERFHIDAFQMLGPEAPAGHTPSLPLVTLGGDDVPEMLDLVARTRPGPFRARTFELGTYLGIRDGGALVAMAGERLHPSGFTEISAVCTDPAHRGRGLAGTLVRVLLGRIAERGERAFLHVATTNTGALRLYESLGFTTRCQVAAVMLQPRD